MDRKYPEEPLYERVGKQAIVVGRGIVFDLDEDRDDLPARSVVEAVTQEQLYVNQNVVLRESPAGPKPCADCGRVNCGRGPVAQRDIFHRSYQNVYGDSSW